MTTMQAKLTLDQAKLIDDELAVDELDGALAMLHQVAYRQNDEDLQTFCIGTSASITRLARKQNLRTISMEALGNERNEIIAAIRAEVLARVSDGPALPSDPSLAERAPGADGPATTSRAEPPRSTILRCKDLSKHYRGGFQLAPVTIELKHGQIAGVVGFNGAGKTTLLRMIAGDLIQTTGTVEIGRHDDRGRPLTTPVTFVPQIIPPLRGTLLGHLRQQAAFFGFDTEETNAAAIENTTNLLRLEAYLDRPWEELPGGYRTRAAVAAALVANPGLLVLDEPLAPLDLRAQQSLLQDLRTRASFAGTAIVVSSQHIPEIESVADIMVLISEKRILVDEVSRAARAGAVLFEVGVLARNQQQLYERLTQLRQDGAVAAFVLTTTGAAVRFNAAQNVQRVAAAVGGTQPIYVRDLSNSALAAMYPELDGNQGDSSR